MQEQVYLQALQAGLEMSRTIISQMLYIAAPGQGYELDLIAVGFQRGDQFPVVQVSTGKIFQTAIDNQSDAHGRLTIYAE